MPAVRKLGRRSRGLSRRPRLPYSDAFVHHALGFSFLLLGEPEEAVRAWLRTLELKPHYDASGVYTLARSGDRGWPMLLAFVGCEPTCPPPRGAKRATETRFESYNADD
jgi:hypothetical protein